MKNTLRLPLEQDPNGASCLAHLADRWQTQFLDHGAERLIGLSLHKAPMAAMVAPLNVVEAERLILNLQGRVDAIKAAAGKAVPIIGDPAA